MWVFEADKSKALGLVCVLVSDHLGLHEGGEMAERPCQYFISDIITQVTTEYPEITCSDTIALSQRVTNCAQTEFGASLLLNILRCTVYGKTFEGENFHV